MNNISIDNVVLFHQKIIRTSGGSGGIKDKTLVDAALNRGLGTFDGKDLYNTDIEKISAITHSLISNHPFVDGNKRIGVSVMLILLQLNNIKIQYQQSELVDLGLGIASGRYKYEAIVVWLNNHVR
ncbi:MAG: type II toxin-antitoxin system death-on-curing family toxin [Clostridiales bacterium]|nr:type II toxin-antitoxin system death-on-curing family toxin [Clostridiales bacterium]